MRKINLAVLIVAALVVAGCTKKTPEKTPVVARAAKKAPRKQPLVDPLTYVEKHDGKPYCAEPCSSKQVRIFRFDFAYNICKKGWKEHYIIDVGLPDLPIHKDVDTTSQLHERVEAAAVALLRSKGVSEAMISYGIVSHFPRLSGISFYIKRNVRKTDSNRVSPPKWPSRVEKIAWSQLDKRIESTFKGVNHAAYRMAMTPLEKRRAIWIDSGCQKGFCVDEIDMFVGSSKVNMVLIWSPQSKKVYVIDNPRKNTPVEDLTLSVLRELGQQEVKITYTLIPHYPKLIGLGEWIPVKI